MTTPHWTGTSPDPNSETARDYRRRVLSAAWREPVENRIAYISGLVAGKRVLDVGVVDHAIGRREKERWLHGAVANRAASCLGVDVLPEAIAALQARGYNVLLRDVTAEPLDEVFDIIVCGEVIEHLGHPAGLFKAAGKMLASGGRLVLTTPNPYYIGHVRNSFHGVFDESVDHVTLLTPSGIAELAEREGMSLDAYRGAIGRRLQKWRGRMRYDWVKRRYGGPATDRFSRTMIYECVKEPPARVYG